MNGEACRDGGMRCPAVGGGNLGSGDEATRLLGCGSLSVARMSGLLDMRLASSSSAASGTGRLDPASATTPWPLSIPEDKSLG